MTLLSRLERRFGRWAVPNLTGLIIAGQAAVLLVTLVRGNAAPAALIQKISLDPSAIYQGEVWRLATFPFQPPVSALLFALLAWMVFYLFGNSLEQTWGAFRYNVYLLIAYVANVAAAFAVDALWGIGGVLGGQSVTVIAAGMGANAVLYGGVFFAFARLFPDMVINLFFVLPIRIRWLGLLGWVSVAYGLLAGSGPQRVFLLAMVANYLLFFGREHVLTWKHGQRRRKFESQVKRVAAGPRHRCVVCGLDSESSPRTLFRYCSKCTGQQCYCPDHIRDHEHVSEAEPAQRG